MKNIIIICFHIVLLIPLLSVVIFIFKMAAYDHWLNMTFFQANQ